MIIEKKYLSLMQGRLVKPLNKPIQEFPLKDWKKEMLVPERLDVGKKNKDD